MKKANTDLHISEERSNYQHQGNSISNKRREANYLHSIVVIVNKYEEVSKEQNLIGCTLKEKNDIQN